MIITSPTFLCTGRTTNATQRTRRLTDGTLTKSEYLRRLFRKQSLLSFALSFLLKQTTLPFPPHTVCLPFALRYLLRRPVRRAFAPVKHHFALIMIRMMNRQQQLPHYFMRRAGRAHVRRSASFGALGAWQSLWRVHRLSEAVSLPLWMQRCNRVFLKSSFPLHHRQVRPASESRFKVLLLKSSALNRPDA